MLPFSAHSPLSLRIGFIIVHVLHRIKYIGLELATGLVVHPSLGTCVFHDPPKTPTYSQAEPRYLCSPASLCRSQHCLLGLFWFKTSKYC